MYSTASRSNCPLRRRAAPTAAVARTCTARGSSRSPSAASDGAAARPAAPGQAAGNRSSSRCSNCSTESAPVRPAASSSASGIPSRRRPVPVRGEGCARQPERPLPAAARSANSRTASVSPSGQREGALAVDPQRPRPRRAPQPRGPAQQLARFLRRPRRLRAIVDGLAGSCASCCAGPAAAGARRGPAAVAGRRREHLPAGPMVDTDCRTAVRGPRRGRAAVVPLTGGNLPTYGNCCRRLDGIPLALELAAGRTGALSSSSCCSGSTTGRLLTGAAGARCRAIRRCGRRSAGARAVHVRATAAVGAALRLQRDSSTGGGRYSAAGPVCRRTDSRCCSVSCSRSPWWCPRTGLRGAATGCWTRSGEYGSEWLGPPATDGCGGATADGTGACDLVRADWFSPRQSEVAARIDSELPNLRTAMECSLEFPATHIWRSTSRARSGSYWSAAAGSPRPGTGGPCAGGPAERDTSRLQALWVWGTWRCCRGTRPRRSPPCRSAARRRESGDPTAAAYALHRTGCLALVTDDMERAELLLRRAIASYGEIGELNSNVLMGRSNWRGGGLPGRCGAGGRDLRGGRGGLRGPRGALGAGLRAVRTGLAQWTRGEMGRPGAADRVPRHPNHAFHDLLGTVLGPGGAGARHPGGGRPTEAHCCRVRPSGSGLGGLRCSVRLLQRPHALCEERSRKELGNGPYERIRREGSLLEPDEAVERAVHGPLRREDRRPCSAGSEGTTGRRGGANLRKPRGTSGSAGVVLDDQLARRR